MQKSIVRRHLAIALGVIGASAAGLYGCGDDTNPDLPGSDGGSPDATTMNGMDAAQGSDAQSQADAGLPGTPGPDAGPQQFLAPKGNDLADGKQVFRFETFGDEGFWTRVLELPQGMKAQGVTPAAAIAAGLAIDSDAIPAALKAKFAADLATAGANPNLATLPSFMDPANTEALLEANAVVGLSARNVTTLNGTLDIDPTNVYAGESIGVSCALCHSTTDGSVLKTATGGSIGKRVDGLTNHNLQVGKSIALGNNSRAYYPTLALDLVANNHGSTSRKGAKTVANPLISAAPVGGRGRRVSQ